MPKVLLELLSIPSEFLARNIAQSFPECPVTNGTILHGRWVMCKQGRNVVRKAAALFGIRAEGS